MATDPFGNEYRIGLSGHIGIGFQDVVHSRSGQFPSPTIEEQRVPVITRFQQVVKDNDRSVKLKGGRLLVSTPDTNNSKVKALMASWFYNHAKHKFQSILDEALLKFKKENIVLERMDIKRMKNRWGSCTNKGVVTLNPELIKAPSKCIEYVILHELCHLSVPNHNKEFYVLLEKKMPNWKKWKNYLERTLK